MHARVGQVYYYFYTYLCICMCVHASLFMCVCVCECACACMLEHEFACARMCMCWCKCVGVRVCKCVCDAIKKWRVNTCACCRLLTHMVEYHESHKWRDISIHCSSIEVLTLRPIAECVSDSVKLGCNLLREKATAN